VIAGKTYQFIAMRKPVIVGDCDANRELFTDRCHVLMTRMGDAAALAASILELKNDEPLRNEIGRRGYELFCRSCSTVAIGKELGLLINSIEESAGHEK
jgi:glycosyltransferase involved in cell wall biosynthesis